MKIYALHEGQTLRAWPTVAGRIYRVGCGPSADFLLDPRLCSWETLCQVEAQPGRLVVTEIGEGVPLVGPKGPASLVALRNFESLAVGPFRLGALEELQPPDFFEGEPGGDLLPTAPASEIVAPKASLLFQTVSAGRRGLYPIKHGFRMGRHKACLVNGLRLANINVSAKHAAVEERRDGFYLTDLGSAHGTFVNGVRLMPDQWIRLEAGVNIRLSLSDQVPRLEVVEAGALLRGRIKGQLAGESEAMRGVLARAHTAAESKSRAPFLILGETGTGKEVVSEEIRRAYHFKVKVVLDCTILPLNLIESEIFGTTKNAFTGAIDRAGLIEEAAGGMLFVDEIGDLPYDCQGKLLRFFDTGQMRRLGSNDYIEIDCLVVAATHRNLEAMVEQGKFRQDLWERLKDNLIRLPPLRARKEDILPIAQQYLESREAKEIVSLSREAGLALLDYDWPGNARELTRLLERAATETPDGEEISEATVRGILAERETKGAAAAPAPGNVPERVRAYERALMEEGLKRHGYKLKPTAETLGYPITTLRRRAIEYGLITPGAKDEAE